MNVVLFNPEIHFNTGNVGRSCVGAGASLHLIEPLGFSLDAKQIRRSGLDYWPKLDLHVHKNWGAFLSAAGPDADLFFFTAEARKAHWDAPFREESYLVFGKESVGLPTDIREKYADRLYRVPHSDKIRSLNLATAAGVVLFEALRQTSRTPI